MILRKVVPSTGLFSKGWRRGSGGQRLGSVKPVRLVGASRAKEGEHALFLQVTLAPGLDVFLFQSQLLKKINNPHFQDIC